MGDYLTYCVLEAQKAGVSYGQYMSGIKSKAIKPHEKPLPVVEEKKPIVKVCQNCGMEFTLVSDHGNRYCCVECYEEANKRLAMERYYARKEAKRLGIEKDK